MIRGVNEKKFTEMMTEYQLSSQLKCLFFFFLKMEGRLSPSVQS